MTIRRHRPGIATLLLAMWLGTVSAAAEELVCPSPSIARPDARPVAFGHGLLWRLEAMADPAASPSFLFGTIHVSDPAVVEVAAPVRQALEDSRTFVMEAMFDAQSVAAFASAMTLPAGQTPEGITGPALFERSRALLAQFDVPTEAAQRMRPWAAFMTLNQPRGDAGTPLDLVLMQRATEAGKPVAGIETLREQAEVFAAFSDDEQVTMLRDTVCNFDRLQADIERLRRSYLARDLQAIVRMTEEFEGSDPVLSRRMLTALIDQRNERMATRLGPHLKQGGVFIAVGALHLPGERGLLSLLSRRGYRAVRVY